MAISTIDSTGLSAGGVAQSNLGTGVAGTGPAFSAYLSGNQTVSANTFTKVQFNAKLFDTNSNYDSATNYRFTPTVAGYYQMSLVVGMNTTAAASISVEFRKNGSSEIYCGQVVASTYALGGSSLIYMNGSTDYVEAYVYVGSGAGLVINGGTSPQTSLFTGCLIRSA